MGRLTESDRQGNWWLEGVPWKDTYVGQTITANTSEKIYGALCKLKDYEDTGLTPKEIMDGKLLTGWIEVEERSPNDGQIVLVSNGQYIYLVEYDADWDAPYGDVDDIAAWMPLPEPYKQDN